MSATDAGRPDEPASPPGGNAFVRLISRVLGVEPREAPAVAWGLLLFFSLFAGYFMLRPVRETMGIAGGVDNLAWLFTATFVVTLAVMPLFGALASRVARRRVLLYSYAFFVTNLVAFAAAFVAKPDDPWVARAFYVWLSMFTMVAVSIAWSHLADLFRTGEAKRLFALLATGASFGGLAGPLLGTLLVGSVGHAGLLLISAALLGVSIYAAHALLGWRARNPAPEDDAAGRAVPLGGSPFAGATIVFRSPFLLGIAAFVVLLASTTTFLYFDQARLVELAYPDRVDQTRVFGTIDVIVQSLAIATQMFFTGRIASRLGIVVLLTIVPFVIAGGFVALALSPAFMVLAVVMVIRRAGEYALVRPGREMLFTVVPPESKYKAKNFIDTVVYRGGDAVSGWVKAGLDAIATSPAMVSIVGCAIAIVWGLTGIAIGRARETQVAERS